MESLKQYRKKVKVLESEKQKISEDFNRANALYKEGLGKVETDLKETHTGLDTILVTEAEKLFNLPNREKAIYKGLYLRDPKAAVDWLKTKFHVSKSALYPSTVKRVKKAFGYSAKVGTDFQDFVMVKHENYQKIVRDLYLTSVAKKPRNNVEHFGVEIEFFMPSESDVRQKFQDYCTENRIKGAQIKTDSSISPHETNHVSYEITILIPKDNTRDLELVCKWLNSKKAKVNKSCGLHVHLDFRNKDTIELAGTRLYNSLPYLSRLVPETRRSSSYCKLEKNTIDSGSKYSAINLSSYRNYKTLEVRLHSGTCNYGKITSWIMVLDNIINNTKFDKPQSDTTIDKFVELLEFKNDSLNYYLYERYKKFNGENTVKEEKGEE